MYRNNQPRDREMDLTTQHNTTQHNTTHAILFRRYNGFTMHDLEARKDSDEYNAAGRLWYINQIQSICV